MPRTATLTEWIHITVTPDMLARIKAQQDLQRRGFSEMVRVLLDDGLAAQERTLVDTPEPYVTHDLGPNTLVGPGVEGYRPWDRGTGKSG